MYNADARHDNDSLQGKLRHLYTLRGGPAIDLTIRPDYYELLRRLGDPHLHLPPVIHVAGTNGKGSTIAILRAMLEAARYKAHVYTSPHLRRFNERIVLAGREIEDAALEALLDEVTAAANGLKLTFFEVTTALAFLAFARVPADITLLETGLGGRLDCTNVAGNKVACVITPIGMDHCEFLGDTLTRIAGEKAGIMARGVPCIIAPQSTAAVDSVFESAAGHDSCVIHPYGKTWRIAERGAEMDFHFGSVARRLPRPALVGAHQIVNAGVALACLEVIHGFPVTDAARSEGLRAACWPARLQRLDQDAATENEVWVDGGHNGHAAAVLAAQAEAWRQQDRRDLHLILGMMETKDPAAFLMPLSYHLQSMTAVPLSGETPCHDPHKLAAIASGLGVEGSVAADLASAIRKLKQDYPQGRILIAGSLYLAGEALGLSL